MTKEEVYQLIYVVKANFTGYYAKFTQRDFDNMADGWFWVLEDYDFKAISLALKTYCQTNTSNFPPVPAQLISYTMQQNPLKEMSSAEAWDLVYKAISRALYYSEEEFNKLPELCQKAIGSAASLKELASMDMDTVKSVEGSHFKRNYETLVKRQREYEKIPQKTRDMLEALQSQTLIEQKE